MVRTSCTTTSRINKRIALWACHKASSQCKNWFYVVGKRFLDLQVNNDLSIHQGIGNNTDQNLRVAIMNKFKNSWFESVHNPVGPSGRGGNKLRMYALFKSVFEAEMYCKKLLPLRHRAAFAKFRCGVAPLRIETGRFENRPLEERKCPFCDTIGNEKHVLLDCNKYSDLRHELFSRAMIVEPFFSSPTMI